MINRLVKLLLAFLCLPVIFLSGCDRSSQVGLGPGDQAPDFELSSLSAPDTKIKLSQFRGKLVLLNFWASWCGPCILELPNLEKLYTKYKDKGLVILAVGVDDHIESLRSFQQKYGLSFPIVVDSDGRIRDRFKISGFPESLLVAPNGSIVLFPDVDSAQPVTKSVGPREWESPNMLSRLAMFLPPASQN